MKIDEPSTPYHGYAPPPAPPRPASWSLGGIPGGGAGPVPGLGLGLRGNDAARAPSRPPAVHPGPCLLLLLLLAGSPWRPLGLAWLAAGERGRGGPTPHSLRTEELQPVWQPIGTQGKGWAWLDSGILGVSPVGGEPAHMLPAHGDSWYNSPGLALPGSFRETQASHGGQRPLSCTGSSTSGVQRDSLWTEGCARLWLLLSDPSLASGCLRRRSRRPALGSC